MWLKIARFFNVIIAIILLVSLGFYLGNRFEIKSDENSLPRFVKVSENEKKLKHVFHLLDEQYISEINSDSLMEITLNNMLKGLDPHSVYLSSKKNSSTTDISGNFHGLGIEYFENNDTIVIIRAFPNTENFNYLFPGDKLLTVNGKSVTGNKASNLENIFSNSENFNIHLIRNQAEKAVEVAKQDVKIPNIKSTYKLNSHTGYIKLAHFSTGASKEFRNALLDLKKAGANSLVLDLRDNGGGLLEEAEIIADEFLSGDKMICYLKNEKDNEKTYYYATNKGVFEKGEVKVLINENSASASEVLAGALQDNDRATIYGRRSFGKGLVQKEVKLEDGSTFRMTIAQYYTPLGRSIQKDFKNSDYENELVERYHSGELYDETKIKRVDSLTFRTPKGKIIYGGGGIIPDVFVPIEAVGFGKTFYENNGFSIIKSTIVEDISTHIPEYFSYKEDQFTRSYHDARIQKKIEKKLTNLNIHLNADGKKYMELYIKAYVARALFGDSTYYRIWNQQDNMIKKVS